MARFPIIILLCFFIAVGAEGQGIVSIFNTENGLPANGTLGLQFDEETGFLWVATEAGLVRYNGLHFKNYPREFNINYTQDRRIFLVRNNKNEIYTADRLRNTFRIKDNRNSFYKQFPGMQNQAGKLFLITTTETLLKNCIDRKDNFDYLIPYDKIANWQDTACLILKDGKLIRYGLSGESMLEHPKTTENLNSLFKIEDIIYIKDKADRIYFYDPATRYAKQIFVRSELKRVIELEKERHLLIWENGMKYPILFIGTRAWILKRGKKYLDAIPIAYNIPENTFISYAQYSEKRKMLFIGTDSKGIMIIHQPSLESIATPGEPYQNRNASYGQLELEDGSILTNQGLIYALKDSSMISKKRPDRFYFSIFKTHDSLLWYTESIANMGGRYLQCFNQSSGQSRTFDKILVKENVAVAAMDSSVLIANDRGIGRLSGDSIRYFTRFPAPGVLLYQMEEFKPGIYLLASCQGLLRFNVASQKIDTLMHAGNYCVRNFRIIGDYVLIGTFGNGIYIWKNGKTVKIPLDKNNYLRFSHCFFPDNKGYCWISTNKGLFKALTKELLASFNNPKATIYYHYFGTKDGMRSTELNGGCFPCAISLRNGKISFPSMDGLVWADPDQKTEVIPEGRFFVDEWIINDKPLNPDSALLNPFPAGTTEVTLRFGITAWTNKENIQVEYSLNDDDKWEPVFIENEEAIRLNNLEYGDYKIRIRIRKGYGENNYSYLEYKFTIEAPWNRKGWFYGLSGIFAISVFWSINNIRNRQQELLKKKLQKQVEEKTKELTDKNYALEKGNAIKNRLISIISHDIITPLKFMTAAGKNLLDKRKIMPEELRHETIKEITETSQELQFLSTNILNWIKFQNEKKVINKEVFNVSEMVEQVFAVLHATAKQKNIGLLNEVDKDLQIRQYYEPTKIVIYNLVLNAINFSEKGFITVRNSKQGGLNNITVIDRGVGMRDEQVSNILDNEFIISSPNLDNRKGNGLGYLIIKDLTKMMSAQIQIESMPGKGTSVSILLPPDRKNKQS